MHDGESLFSRDELGELVKIVAGSSALAQSKLNERRRFIFTGLAELVEADAWALMQVDGIGIRVGLNGGWGEQRRRDRLLGVLNEPFVREHISKPLCRTAMVARHVTRRREELISDEQFRNSGTLHERLREAKLDSMLFSARSLGQERISVLSLHRRRGKPPFSPRESDLVHLVNEQIDWLHAGSADDPHHLAELSRRERQVLQLLLDGGSRKQIALKLGISEHTLGDYIKSLHRHFNVSSRGELLSLFIRR